MQNIFLVSFTIVLLLPFSSGDDNDENFFYANNNNKFVFNTRKNCQQNYYFDNEYFKCRLCDPNFHLMSSARNNVCVCEKNSTEIFEYDNILKRPLCEKAAKRLTPKCAMRFVNATKFSSIRKSVRVSRVFGNGSCSCDEKGNENYRGEYCIRSELFKDLKNYQNYKNLPLTQTLNLYNELKYVVFFCKVLHQRSFCNYLANLCVLTHFDLDKNGPCYHFYRQQTQLNEINFDETNIGNELDGGEKLKPFLFFKRTEKSQFEKFVDFSYGVTNANSSINLTIVSYGLRGNLIEMRPLRLSDLNLCNRLSAPANAWQPNVKFAKNFFAKCTVNLREFINLQPNTKFSSIYLNFFEKHLNYLETIPILVRNAFEVNQREDIEEWQLVKRFFMIDTISGRQTTTNGKTLIADDGASDDDGEDETKFYEQFSQINYVKSIELRIQLNDDDDEHSNEINRINIPLLIVVYDTLNLTNISNAMKSSPGAIDENQLYNIDFSFSIKFIKRPNLNFFFQIILPVFIFLSFFYAIMQAFFYKVRQQRVEYDFAILLNFVINLLSNISNALFALILMFVFYVFVIYKTQSSTVKMILPLEKEKERIGILLGFAIACKIVKLSAIFYDMINFDIFFVDFERPKYQASDNFMHSSSNKSHPGTPSITSSFKPTLSSPSPVSECVSAWRNYFMANEWQELMTKRKICIHSHVALVVVTLMVLGFENFSSLEFNLHLNRVGGDPDDANNDNILLKLAVGSITYLALYLSQRLFNFLIYERFIDNCLQQFTDISSIANISVLILLNSYGYYIHGRSVHGRSDIDTFNMILQFKREEENLCGHRGLLPGGDQQTYTILAPKNLRLFYEKLINPITNRTSHSFDHGFEKMVLTYHNINRFFAAFIDHALKDVDYVVKEKNVFEKLLDCELYSEINDSKGVFYFDNGHSFDKVLFYGNENSIFIFEFLLFVFLLFTTGNFLIASLTIGIVFKLLKEVINHLTKNNLARKTMIDKRFLI